MKKIASASEQNIENRLDILKEMPERNSAMAELGRAKFLAQAKTMQAYMPGPVPKLQQFRSFFNRKISLRSLNWVTAAIMAVGLFFGSSAITVYASQGSLPGEALYPLKIWSEDSLLSLTPSLEGRLNLTLNLTDRRMIEIARLQSAGRPIPLQVINRFNAELDQSLALAAEMPTTDLSESLHSVTARAEEQLQRLDDLMVGTAPTTGLTIAQTHLQVQVEVARYGQANPQGFIDQMEEKSNQGKPGKQLAVTETPTITPTETMTPSSTLPVRKPTHTPKVKLTTPKGNPHLPAGATPHQ